MLSINFPNGLPAFLMRGTFTQAQLQQCGSTPIDINIPPQQGYFVPLFIFIEYFLGNLNSLNFIDFTYPGIDYIARFPVATTREYYQTVHNPINQPNLIANTTLIANGNTDDLSLTGFANYRIYYLQITDSI